MNLKYFITVFALLLSIIFSPVVAAKSTREERRLINKGNSLYNESKFVEAQNIYEQALQANGTSAEARYNLALSQIRQVTNPVDTAPKTKKLVDEAKKNFLEVASLAKTKPGLAAKSNYNLGNIEFNSKDFQKAIDYYKQALRIDPKDDRARKNLRIAQKNLQKQQQDQQNQNKQDNKDDKKNQDKEQDKNKDNKDQNNQNNENKDKNDKKQNELSQQTAAQILQAIDNKESATRARVNKANKGEKNLGTGSNNRKW